MHICSENLHRKCRNRNYNRTHNFSTTPKIMLVHDWFLSVSTQHKISNVYVVKHPKTKIEKYIFKVLPSKNGYQK